MATIQSTNITTKARCDLCACSLINLETTELLNKMLSSKTQMDTCTDTQTQIHIYTQIHMCTHTHMGRIDKWGGTPNEEISSI